ncbi:polysaccharide deacetylase family protein [Modestobacter sp. SYSU DS0290]
MSAAGRLVHRLAAPAGSVVGVRTAAPHVVLTFDDGPEPGGTDRVLAALAQHGATATFFVLLTRVARHGGLLDEVVAAGHEIGLHGVDHRPLPDFRATEVARRTRAGRAALEDRTGRAVRWFRPPYGRQTPQSWLAVRSAGLVPVMWGATTWDWRDVPQEERVAKALSGSTAGAVLLAHDGIAGPDDGVDDGPPPVVDRGDLVDRVLRGLAQRSLSARSLGDALASGDLVKAPRFSR